MNLEFRPTGPEEKEAVRTFLANIFEIPLEAPLIAPEHLDWKYYQPHPAWSNNTSRSYVYSNGAHYAAHASTWPFRIQRGASIIHGSHPIDWAAGSDVPGIGALLLRKLRTITDISCCIGGTDIAQKVIAQTGYRADGEIKYYSRPLHAWRQFLTYPRRDAKLPARLVRNFLWSHNAGVHPPKGWSAERITPDSVPSEVLPKSSNEVTVCERTPALFRYLETSHTAPHHLYLARCQGQPAGYFLLSLPPGQARIADAWTVNNNVDQWQSLYALAVHTAYKDTQAGEVTASSALKPGQQALENLKFRAHLTLPLMLFDPKKLLADAPPIHFQMIDNDFSFLHTGSPDYQT